MRRLRVFSFTAVVAMILAGLFGSVATACPFCSAPSLTLSEQLAQSDAAVLAGWADGETGDAESIGSTTYKILRILRNPGDALKVDERVTLSRYRAASPGELFLLLGTRSSAGIEWGSPLEITETGFNYLAQAPSPESPKQARLEYFMKFLENSDPLIANDTYAEFANADYSEIAPLAEKMPREKLRKWITDDQTTVTRLGLYGLMLGLCGNEEDAKLMHEKVVAPTEDFRLGIDGVMGGYLLLTKAEGLEVLERTKLEDKSVPFSETYAAMQALRFMWQYGDGRISKEDLRASMRLLLTRPELADLVIADLSRWQDWSVQDRLMELYGTEGYDIPSIRRAIVRFLMVSAHERTKVAEGEAPAEHVAQAETYLAQLEERDPKTVKEAKRFFFLK